MDDLRNRRSVACVCLLLAAITLLLYWPVTSHDFIGFDDQDYLTENFHVRNGLTGSGIVWAFRSGYAANWHPLTWISHMVDCQLYGLNPLGHHLTNLLFHVANSLLVFLLLRQLTGAVWRSAFVAALFAWHPLHVESVAWAAERKDVLSTCFWILTLMAYLRYVKNPNRSRYLLTLLLFALGLMSKPMVVTLPFVLLLLDFWPLGRLRLKGFAGTEESARPAKEPIPAGAANERRTESAAGLIREKLPFFALTLVASIVTFWAQHAGGAVSTFKAIPLQMRIANALLTYLRYISKTFWPDNLAVVYPYPRSWSVSLTIAAMLALVIGSGWIIWRARKRPYLMTGWFWYVGTLVPTIGLIQVGSQAMADRYMYIPSIGLFMVVVWGLADLAAAWPRGQKVLAGFGIMALAAFLAATWVQLKYWQSGERLFRHTIEVTTDNFVAYTVLGAALDDQGRKEEALSLYRQSVAMEPRYPEGQYNLGTALLKMGRLDEAISHFTAALRDSPQFALAHNNLGKALRQQGKLDEAARHLLTAVRLAPDDPEAHFNLGTVLLVQSKLDEAVARFSEALRLNPNYAQAHGNLAVVLMSQGKTGEGIRHFSEATRLDPGNPETHFNLGLALMEQGRTGEAAAQFSQALRLQPNDARFHYRLATALVRQHDAKGAVTRYREALRLQPDFPDALNGLAWILASDPNAEFRSGEEAVRLAERAGELTRHEQAGLVLTLAAAYAEAGRFPDAVATAQKARDLALAAGQTEVAAKAGEMQKLFQAGQPFRETR